MYRDIKKIIPHRDPMVMIDGYHKIDSDHASAEKTFHSGDYGVCNGYILDSILIECVAQTVAAHLGYKYIVEKSEKGQAKKGMLVSVDTFAFLSRARKGSTVHIKIKKTNELGAFKMFNGKLLIDDQLIAEGDLKLYEVEQS